MVAMTSNSKGFVCLTVVGLAAYGIYSWWKAPPTVKQYTFDDELDLDEIEALVRHRKRGTRGKGRKVVKLSPITKCSLVGDAEALLVGVGRGAQVARDCLVRLQAVVKLEGCTINGVYHPKEDFSPTFETIFDGDNKSVINTDPVISSQRLNQAIRWSIQQATYGDAVLESRLVQAGSWVNLWMVHSDATVITGRCYHFWLRLEWKVRTSLGLNLPLPSQ